jgi:hypothetical protein
MRHPKSTPLLTLQLRMKSVHAFFKPFECINVELIIRNYSKKKITNALIRPFETIAITCQIYEGKEGNYLLAFMVVTISQRSYLQAQLL